MEWAWKCCGNCHLSDKCELKEELVDKGQFCEKYLPKPINEELDFVQEHNMTNEKQTISNLRKLKSFHNGSYGADIDRAIKALEQEPKTETKTIGRDTDGNWHDLSIISEQEQKTEPCEDCCNGNQIEKAKLCQRSYLAGMEHKQEPKTGHWIADAKTYYEELNKRGLRVDEYTPYFTDDIACSECLAKYSMLDNETQFFKYCPNCGAKMESESSSEKPNKWIPVSERLPKEGQNVLFCDIDDDIMVGYHVKGRPETHFSQDGTYEDVKNVRAWMPLPEPYKESEDKE